MAIYRDSDDAPGPFDTATPPANLEDKIYEFQYDALGRRVVTIQYIDEATGDELSTPRRTVHVYSGLETIQEYVCGGGFGSCESSSGTLARQFIWGDENYYPEPVAMLDHTDLGSATASVTEVFYYLHDALGSVIALTDSNGVVRERYTYDPYGKTYIETWHLATGVFENAMTSFVANPYFWTGQRHDPASQTYHFWARTYSPSLGRWLQRDPIEYDGGSINLYEYVNGNPIALFDPFGMEPTQVLAYPPPTQSDTPTVAQVRAKKCQEAARLRFRNCRASYKAGGSDAPTMEDCYDELHENMAACRRGQPGSHTKTVLFESRWLDCFEDCVALGTQLCLGAGPIAGRGAQIDVARKHVEASKRGTERLVSRILVPKDKALRRLVGGKRLTRFIRATRGFGGGVFWGALAVGECVAAVEVGCAAGCAAN